MIEEMKPVKVGAWTHFHDMHSGGGLKTQWEHIYIEAPEAEAKRIFEERTGRDPDNETCSCCGGDYSIREEESLEQATGYERGCGIDATGRYVERKAEAGWRRHQKYVPLDEYETGRYLTRKQAFVSAAENDQIKNGKIIGGVLTSEDLW